MATVHALQHVFSSVVRGYFPQQGRGFQTVAVSAELIGTEDLRVLEDAAFYALRHERRRIGDLPVKETFFHLPSGRLAIGRTVDWGTDSLGREGNYLTHHLIVTHEDLLKIEANPFALLDTAPLAEAGIDLTPRALPALALEVGTDSSLSHFDSSGFEAINMEVLANLAIAAVDGGAKSALIISNDAPRSASWQLAPQRTVLKGLLAALPIEDRLRLTFSTHFYESHHLRSLFRFVTVGSLAEAPSQRQDYIVFDLDAGEFPRLSPASACAAWLADCLRSGRWDEVRALNALINSLRSGQGSREKDAPPTTVLACRALWERLGTDIVQVLIGDARLVIEFLRHVPSPRLLADALLQAASPSALCGAAVATEAATACLSVIHSSATRNVWQAWVKQWSADPALGPFVQNARPWWQRWRR